MTPVTATRTVDAKPTVSTCGGCGADVLLVHAPGPLIVDKAEANDPYPCPVCERLETRGQEPQRGCSRCGDRRTVGDGLPREGVAIGEDEQARYFTGRRRRKRGESIHRLHTCHVPGERMNRWTR